MEQVQKQSVSPEPFSQVLNIMGNSTEFRYLAQKHPTQSTRISIEQKQ